MTPVLLWIITSILFVIGLFGTVIPAVPGVGFVFLGILIYAAATEFATISVVNVIVFGVIASLAWLADYIGSVVGVRVAGGKKLALAGTIIGTILGLFIAGPIGLFIGAFAGGLLGTLLEGKSQSRAIRVALFSLLGVAGAAIFQFFLAFIMIAAFLIIVLT